MRKRFAGRIGLLATYAVLTALAYAVFHAYLWNPENQINDFKNHAYYASEAVQSGSYQPHMLYHVVLNVLTGFSGDQQALRSVSPAVLAVTILLKLVLTAALLRMLAVASGRALDSFQVAALVWILFFVAPIPNWHIFPRVYLGQFTPNVWHNPTTIVLMPFCVAAFLLISKRRDMGLVAAALCGLLVGASALAKPHLALVLLPALGLWTALRQFEVRAFLAIALPPAAVLAWQFQHSFSGEDAMYGGVEFQPLAAWLRHCSNPGVALLVSFAFPITVLLGFGRRLRHPRAVSLAWTLTGVALAQFLLLAETGGRLQHANFYWGTVPALYLLMVVSVAELWLALPDWSRRKYKARILVSSIALGLHVASGVYFYIRNIQVFNVDA